MKRRDFSFCFDLYLLIMAIFLIISCSGGGGEGGAAADAPTYTISGTVCGGTVCGEFVADVTINLIGTSAASTITNSNGSYSFSGLANGNYTITPVKTGYTFNPASSAVTINGLNQTGKNFEAIKVPTYIICGTVSGDVLDGVKITLGGAGSVETYTSNTGIYCFSLVQGSYTVTPSAVGYTFSPESRSVNVSDEGFTVDNFVATAKPSVTWKEFVLMTSSSSAAGWRRRTLKFEDANPGILFSASSCLDSAGSTTCPAVESLTWTNSAGVISESGSSADRSVHMTITANGNFIAGTGSSASGSYSQLRVTLKVKPATVYAITDLQDKSFVFHELIVGSDTKWRYGRGSTDGSGNITLIGKTDPDEQITIPDTTWGTLLVNANGVVTMSGAAMSTFSGFLADDKKTIAGVYTSGTTYRLMIFQITERNDFPAGPLPESTWKSSFLAKSTSIPIVGVQAGWIHCTNTVDGSGNMTFGTDWTSNNSQFASRRPTTPFTGSITSSGEVIMTDNSYNGQLSHDEEFLTGTMTMEVDVLGNTAYVYLLQVSTR